MNQRGRKRNHSKTTDEEDCVFCGEDKNDEMLYGRLFHKRGITVHEYCLYFSSGLYQTGSRDRVGILRFQIPDIEKEVARGSKLKCFYCKLKGATVGCAIRSCQRTFHYPCGLKNGCLNQHHANNFPSFCSKHKPRQIIAALPAEETLCQICHVSISRVEFGDCLRSPCCRNKWFHRLCLQKYAFNAGLRLFKCPICNDKAKFVREMKTYGISVPDKEAEWESEITFEDFARPRICSARDCRCTYGRYEDGSDRWCMLFCAICGSNATHVECVTDSVSPWKCEDCQSAEAAIAKRRLDASAIQKTTSMQNNATNSGNPVPTSADRGPNVRVLESCPNV